MCGANTAGFNIKMQNPAPQGEKSPIDQDGHRTGEFGSEKITTEGGVLTDAHIKQAPFASLPQTSPTHMKTDVNLRRNFYMVGDKQNTDA